MALPKMERKETGYFNYHVNEDANPHYFMSEELLTPFTSNCDTQRLNMFANHINQMVHLTKPELPKVFTNFETQVGDYSISKSEAKEDFTIIKKIVKNQYNYDLLVQYNESKVYDILHYRRGINITEAYGYGVDDCIADKKEGDQVEKGEFLYKAPNYDEEGNFMYGTNLKAVFLSKNLKTYEDGIVISESAAKKLSSYKCEKIMLSINNNDVLLNLYGDDYNYKSFPRVGDHIDSEILVASRRRNKASIIYDFQGQNLRKIDNVNDIVTYTMGGTVTDITIYNNVSLDELKERTDEFSQEILPVLENQYRYWKEIAAATEIVIPKLTDKSEYGKKAALSDLQNLGYEVDRPIPREENENQYTDELAYYWKLSHETLNEHLKYRYDGGEFSNMRIEFTILKEEPLVPGAKLTGRYGNKGIVSEILSDEKMPITEDGERADVCLNALGVVNRLNLAQIQEQHINFMSDHVIKEMKELKMPSEKFNLYYEYLSYLNKGQADFMKEEYKSLSDGDRKRLMKEIEENGIRVHEPPFFGNTQMADFVKILEDHPEWCEKYKFKNIEKPLVMGDMYFIKLKHSPANKNSARSDNNLNIKDLPSKSTLKRDKKVLYSLNPLRLGEMEVSNLLLTKDGDAISKLLRSYSTSKEMRQDLVSQLIDPGEGNNALDMDFDFKPTESINKKILEKYLEILELELKD